ncbi:hypothetical protein NDU88_003068 [Pleurodeles waltl]|uniref:Uncharacterized protein n=1 Tax=Pleurodeles waltl TaxID=8319 RepID=A0AAV7SEI8_PLEWA|nr:hypothetical protein NDU88_003068 [Pleurodeles waltl]
MILTPPTTKNTRLRASKQGRKVYAGRRAPRIFAYLKRNPAACPGLWEFHAASGSGARLQAQARPLQQLGREAASGLPPPGTCFLLGATRAPRCEGNQRPQRLGAKSGRRAAAIRYLPGLPPWNHALPERGRHQEGASPPPTMQKERQPVRCHGKGTRLLPARKRAAQRECNRRSLNTLCSSAGTTQQQ